MSPEKKNAPINEGLINKPPIENQVEELLSKIDRMEGEIRHLQSDVSKNVLRAAPAPSFSSTSINGLWKTIAVGLGGILVSLIGAWIIVTQNLQDIELKLNSLVTESELISLINTYSPYALDKKYIDFYIKRSDETDNVQTLQINELSVNQRIVINNLKNIDKQLSHLEEMMAVGTSKIKTKTRGKEEGEN